MIMLKNHKPWAAGVIQEVECLTSKCEAQSSNSRTAKGGKKTPKPKNHSLSIRDDVFELHRWC
jgi:hypothetical protein